MAACSALLQSQYSSSLEILSRLHQNLRLYSNLSSRQPMCSQLGHMSFAKLHRQAFKALHLPIWKISGRLLVSLWVSRLPSFQLELIMLAGNIYSILRFYLLTSKPKGSFVTGSTANSWNRLTAMSSYMRLYKDLWQNGLFCNVIMLITTLGAFFYSTAVLLSPTDQDLVTKLLTSVAWPPLLHVCYLTIANNWVPVAYLLDPPAYPDRNSQSTEDETPKATVSLDKWYSMGKASKASRDMLQLGSRLEIAEETEL